MDTTSPPVPDPDEPLEIATTLLSPSVAMPVLNESLPLTPATPASALDRETEPEDVAVSTRLGGQGWWSGCHGPSGRREKQLEKAHNLVMEKLVAIWCQPWGDSGHSPRLQKRTSHLLKWQVGR